jgi:hypothetical protein
MTQTSPPPQLVVQVLVGAQACVAWSQTPLSQG